MNEEKLSIVTDEISQDLDVVAKFAAENDIHTFEIRTVGGKRVPDIDDSIWDDLLRRVRDDGWRVLCLSPGTFKGDFRARRLMRKQLEDIFPRTITKAKQIGAEFIITFGFMAEPKTSPPDHALSAIHEAANMCANAGLPLLLENEPGSFADTGQRTVSLINRAGHPNLFANWDPCNTNIFHPEELAKGAQALGRRMRHVHVKDGKPIPGSLTPMFGPIRTGELGWRRHLIELKDLGYNGYLGVETHYEPLYDSSADLLSELRQLIREVKFFG
jgi:sugar phosphate isomerase/epimerase